MLTENQKRLKEQSGTPEEFASACNAAADQNMITGAECFEAVRKYVKEWDGWSEDGTTRLVNDLK